MAKRLNQHERYRASLCAECGCLPHQEAWQAIIREHGENYQAVMDMVEQFSLTEQDVITIAELASKEELHAVADNYNWDDEHTDALFAFINHPLCDAGTALLLFWKGAGYDVLAKHPQMPQDDKKAFFETLITRFKHKQFATYQIAFNPYEEGYVPSLDETLQYGYVIPGELFCPYSTMYVDTELP